MFFSLLKFWVTESPKIFKQILADLFMITKRTTKQMCQVSLKYIFVFFFTFKILGYRISKNIQANPCGFIHDNKKDH